MNQTFDSRRNAIASDDAANFPRFELANQSFVGASDLIQGEILYEMPLNANLCNRRLWYFQEVTSTTAVAVLNHEFYFNNQLVASLNSRTRGTGTTAGNFLLQPGISTNTAANTRDAWIYIFLGSSTQIFMAPQTIYVRADSYKLRVERFFANSQNIRTFTQIYSDNKF